MKRDTIEDSIKAVYENVRAVVRNTHASGAIVGASIVAEELRGALLSRMRPLSKSLERQLFEGYGPHSSLSSRIDIAFALGIVPRESRDDMNTIRGIRNAFAHSKKILHFTDPEIAERCRKLRAWDASKTDLQAVYMESLKEIIAFLEDVARKGAVQRTKD
jgi:hypothetical protein